MMLIWRRGGGRSTMNVASWMIDVGGARALLVFKCLLGSGLLVKLFNAHTQQQNVRCF